MSTLSENKYSLLDLSSISHRLCEAMETPFPTKNEVRKIGPRLFFVVNNSLRELCTKTKFSDRLR